jgi:hypothetical protein
MNTHSQYQFFEILRDIKNLRAIETFYIKTNRQMDNIDEHERESGTQN